MVAKILKKSQTIRIQKKDLNKKVSKLINSKSIKKPTKSNKETFKKQSIKPKQEKTIIKQKRLIRE